MHVGAYCCQYLFQDVLETLLLDKLRASHNADGFIIQGFPRDMEQAKQYDRLVSHCLLIVCVCVCNCMCVCRCVHNFFADGLSACNFPTGL